MCVFLHMWDNENSVMKYCCVATSKNWYWDIEKAINKPCY